MNTLKELVKFVTSGNRKKLVLGNSISARNKSHKLSKLADASQDPFQTDEKEIIKTIYGRKRNTDSYRKLKSRLKNKLIDSIFLNNTSRRMKSQYDNSLFNVQRNLMAAQILLMQDQRKSAIALTAPALNAALYYQHTQLAVIACRIMCHHTAMAGLTKKFKTYSDLLTKQLKLLQAELEIQSLYNSILLRISKVADYDSQSKILMRKSYAKASSIIKSHRSHIIVLHYYRIAIRHFHSRQLFGKVIMLCKACNIYLEQNPHLYQRARAGEFALYEMDSCLRLQLYEKGQACAQRCNRHFTPFHSPWLVFNEQRFLLAMRTGNYPEALEIFNSVTSSSRFKKLSRVKVETWKIYEAWLNFVLPGSLRKKQFNLFRFLNEVETVSKDKSGFNYSIIIAKVLLLVSIKDKEKLHELETAFRQYLNRHIKKEVNPRHYYFGSLIRLLYNCDFDPIVADHKSKPIIKKLESLKKGLPTLEETEIIPYPVLWKLLIEKCRLMN